MTVDCVNGPIEKRIILRGNVDVLEIADAHSVLKAVGQPGAVVTVDVGGLVHADITLLQLMLVARETIGAEGGSLTIANANNPAWSNLVDSALMSATLA